MDDYTAHGSLLLLIGELLYKNQLLREAIASKDEIMQLIINRLTMTTASDCSCGVGGQLAFVLDLVKARESEFARRGRCGFNKFGDIASQMANSAANPAADIDVRPTEK